MGYSTYDFYKNEYFGDSVDESSFNRANARASDKLNYLCGGRITDDVLAEYPIEIKKATCALMDCMKGIDDAVNNAHDINKGNIKSMSSGGQSISFGNNDTVYTSVMGDIKAQTLLMKNVIREYLYDTDLLYEG